MAPLRAIDAKSLTRYRYPLVIAGLVLCIAIAPIGRLVLRTSGLFARRTKSPVYGVMRAARRTPLGGDKIPWVDSGEPMDFSRSNDQSLLRYYESIRRQVDADKWLGGRYRFLGDTARQYAECLCQELERRRLQFTPIDWPR